VGLGFVLGALVFWLAEPSKATIAAGTAVAIAGEGIRIWAAGHLHKSREVTSSGPYRWLAHPLYVGSSMIGAEARYWRKYVELATAQDPIVVEQEIRKAIADYCEQVIRGQSG